MKSRRTPDRVHVVSPPENDSFAPSDSANIEIIRTLAKISDKLKRSEAERYELLAELREYRKSLRDLEDKSENAEKAYLAVQNKMQSSSSSDGEVSQRQARFEKSLRATEDKMLKAVAGQAVIDKRLRDTEDKQTMIDQRLDQSLSEQTRLGRQMELISEDKSRLLRKIERLEEIVSETQDTLRAKAMVLLTDQTQPANKTANLSAPSWDNVVEDKKTTAAASKNYTANKAKKVTSSDDKWDKYINIQTFSTAGLIAAALLLGWSFNQYQKREVSTTATPAEVKTVTNADNIRQVEELQTAGQSGLSTPVTMTANPTPNDVLDYNDDQLLAAFNNDSDALAAQLNNIEVSAENTASTPIESSEPVVSKPAITDPKITPEMKNFEGIAFAQDPTIQKQIEAEINTASLSQRVKADFSLPSDVKAIEAQALQGNAEAQHNLAAIYTAGHAGVDQNFEKAAFWFREASDNGIANARYNLGVLYHQGLGRERDLARALYWYREAAKLGHAEAQYNLGIAHIEGIGTEYNPQLAAAYFERAANNGIMEAAYNLGLIHDNGLMGQTKSDEALLWYKIATDQGSKEAQSAMEQLAKNLQIGMDDVDNLVDRMQLINESVKGRRAGPDIKAKKTQTSGAQTSAAPLEGDPSLVRQIQEYLMLTGAYAGPADGINGASTREAIRSYQAANGLGVSGEISEELLTSMVGGAMERLGSTN